jgi:hypothetical protein
MNWRRGLFRLWLVASAVWIARTFWWREACLIPSWLGGGGWWCNDAVVDPIGENLKSVALILGPPAAAFLAGLVSVWVLNGFRHNSN